MSHYDDWGHYHAQAARWKVTPPGKKHHADGCGVEKRLVTDRDDVTCKVCLEKLTQHDRVAELKELVRCAQHHIPRAWPQANEWLKRALSVLGYNHAHRGGGRLGDKVTLTCSTIVPPVQKKHVIGLELLDLVHESACEPLEDI